MKHSWTHDDDVLTFFLYRYGEDAIFSIPSVAARMGFADPGSLKMRIKNFAAIDGKDGLNNYAKMSKMVYEEYSGIDKDTHRKECLRILGLQLG